MSEFVEDKVIFEGQVLQTKWLPNTSTERPYRNNSETTFRVITNLKGSSPSSIKVQHRSEGASCGVMYGMGHELLITAYTTKGGELATGLCTENAIPQITLLNYFEKKIDTYIPSRWECEEEHIANIDDPKNCYFLSDEAVKLRQEAIAERWRQKRDAARKKRKE